MIAELTEAIHAGGFRWKPTSLQVMAGGDATAEDLSDVSCFDADGSVLRFSCVDHMIVLGEYIDSEASTLPSLSYRLSKAEANYWMHAHVFKAPAPVGAKLDAWCRGPRASALFGAMNWHLTDEVLQSLVSWELKWLRRCLRLRRGSGESYAEYLVRTAERIREWLRARKHKPIHIQVLTVLYLQMCLWRR